MWIGLELWFVICNLVVMCNSVDFLDFDGLISVIILFGLIVKDILLSVCVLLNVICRFFVLRVVFWFGI